MGIGSDPHQPRWLASPQLLWAVIIVASVLIVRTAWIGDDAYITLRTVDNFVNGHGLTWNTDERVQAYTHPLWMMVLVVPSFFSSNAFLVTLATSIAVSILALFVIATRTCKRVEIGVWVVVTLAMSRSFIDYSTSGLENPLSHLLLGLFFARFATFERSARSLTQLVLLGSLMATTRLDLVLLVAPPLAYAAWQLPARAAIKAGALGLLPLVAWELFSLVYYGTFLATSAFSKLSHQLPDGEVWRQGFAYLVRQIEFDPLSVIVLGAAIVAGFRHRRIGMRWTFASVGVALYLLYVLKVGGCFMAGRFFTAPMVASVCILACVWHDRQPDSTRPAVMPPACGAAVALGFLAQTPTPTLYDDTEAAKEIREGIVDERQFWGRGHTLLGFERSGKPPFTQMTADGRHVRDSGDAVAIRVAVGIFGYHAGPHVHIVDPYALGDAFLARLPAVRFGSWRIGHYYRVLPIGYVQSVKTGDNHLVDRDLAKLLDEIRLITEGPIFSGERWAAIWALNTGRLDGWVDSRFYQKPYYREVPDWALAEPVPNGHPWDAPATVRVHADHGLTIQLAEVGHQKRIDIAADHNDAYKLYFRLGDRVVGESKISKITDHKKVGLQSRDVQVPDTATEAGYDSIALVGSGRDTHLSIGHLVFAADRKRGRKSRAHQRRDGEARDEVEELDEAAQEAEQVEAADEDLQKVEAAQQ